MPLVKQRGGDLAFPAEIVQEEVRRNFQEALEFHFEGMRLAGEPIPEPSSSVDYVEVAA